MNLGTDQQPCAFPPHPGDAGEGTSGLAADSVRPRRALLAPTPPGVGPGPPAAGPGGPRLWGWHVLTFTYGVGAHTGFGGPPPEGARRAPGEARDAGARWVERKAHWHRLSTHL